MDCSDCHDPMRTRVEGEIAAQSIDKGRSVLIQKVYETDHPLLWLAAGECLLLGMTKLSTEGFIFAFGGLDDLAVELLQIVLHPRQRRPGGSFERRVDEKNFGSHAIEALLHGVDRFFHRCFNGWRKL